jgi:2-phospho-L-lactate guanylyltransferase
VNHCIAIVPVKTFSQAKARLASLLTPVQRAFLAENLLRSVLTVLHQIRQHGNLQNFVLVSRDLKVARIAADYDGLFMDENLIVGAIYEQDPLNAALGWAARETASNSEAESLLVLPADLPWLTVSALEEFLAQPPTTPFAKIAPDRQQLGTNALLLNPAALLDFTFYFGENSFQKHLAALKQKEIGEFSIVQNPNLSFDLDEPEDLVNLPETWWKIPPK